jgi:hypothetical protein
MFRVDQTWLAGLSREQLLEFQAGLQQAAMQLMLGSKVTSAGYTQGDGGKNVTFQMSNLANVQITLDMVNRALGLPGMNRRPLAPQFNRQPGRSHRWY